jgi:hypothetical protein
MKRFLHPGRSVTILAILCCRPLLKAQWIPPVIPHPPSPSEIALMAWGPSPSDPALLQEMREAGLNVSGFCRTVDLAAVEASHLTCFVDDPRLNNFGENPAINKNNWTNLPSDEVLKQRIALVRQEMIGHPGALGVFLTDEPPMSSMPALGRVSALLRQAMPERLSYVNLFPYQVSRERLGTDYESYVRALVKTVGQSFLTYDNYALVDGQLNDQFYTNLEIVRRLGFELHTPFWNCIQSNAHFNYMDPSDSNLHLQAYASLAYGSRGIQYFTYFTPPHGNFRLAPIDVQGHRTATWNALRRVNAEVATLAPILAKLHSTGVYHFPSAPPEGQLLSKSTLVESVDTIQHALVLAPAAGRFLIGEFADSANQPYFMFVNKDLTQSFRLNIHLRDKQRKLVLISRYTGKDETFNGEEQWIEPGGAFLFRVE